MTIIRTNLLVIQMLLALLANTNDYQLQLQCEYNNRWILCDNLVICYTQRSAAILQYKLLASILSAVFSVIQ